MACRRFTDQAPTTDQCSIRAHLRAKPPAATEGFITEANMETTDLARLTTLSRAPDDNTVLVIHGGVE